MTVELLREAKRERTADRPALAALRVAYVVGAYPAISHTFIMREVLALRAKGAAIETISIHRPGPEHLLTDEDREAFAETHHLVGARLGEHLRAHAEAIRRCGRRYPGTLASALRDGDPGLRSRIHQLLYFAEGVACWWRCRQLGIRHLHGEFCGPASDAAKLAARLGGPGWSFSFAAHGTDILQVSPSRLARKVEQATFVTCASHFGRAQLMALVASEHWDKIEVARCGVDVSRWRAPRRPVRAGIEVLSVGRMEREKGHRLLLDALADPLLGESEITLTLIGDGPERARLERRAARLGIAERVRFLGRMGQDQIRERYGSADAFCLSSLGEGVPVVLIEAMAMELPVIAPRLMGIPELVEDGRSGILFAPGSAAGLARALASLARSDAPGRAAMGRAGRAMVEREFELSLCSERVAALFASYATGTAPGVVGREPGQTPYAGSARRIRSK